MVKDFYIKIKKYGVKRSFLIFLAKISKTKIDKFHYLKMDIDYLDALKQFKYISISIKELTYNDFLLGDKNVFTEVKLRGIKKRCNDPTYKAYGIIKNGKLIYSTWLSLSNVGLPIKLDYALLLSEEGLLEDSYCHPLERGKGLHSMMNFFRIKKLYELGKTKCIAIVLDGNKPAYNVQMKSGFKDLGCFYAGTLLGIPFCTLYKKKYDCR